MARPGLTRHRKFARLARLLGNEAHARGHLELLWDVAYENGDELLGDAGDVEFLARWAAEPGVLADALRDSGFLDEIEGLYRVHDLWDHAPDYVRKRRTRESERRTKGAELKGNGEQRPVSDRSATGQCSPNGRTRAPAPAPAPALEALETLTSAAPTASASEVEAAEPALTHSVDEAQALWNERTRLPIPRWVRTPDARKRSVRALLASKTGWQDFVAVLDEIASSAFLRGEAPGTDGRRWCVDIGFVLSPSNRAKILEGNYRDRAATPAAPRTGFGSAETQARLSVGRSTATEDEPVPLHRQCDPTSADGRALLESFAASGDAGAIERLRTADDAPGGDKVWALFDTSRSYDREILKQAAARGCTAAQRRLNDGSEL